MELMELFTKQQKLNNTLEQLSKELSALMVTNGYEIIPMQGISEEALNDPEYTTLYNQQRYTLRELARFNKQLTPTQKKVFTAYRHALSIV